MSKKLKKRLIRIIVSLVLFLTIFILEKTNVISNVTNNGVITFWVLFSIYVLIYLLIAYDILFKAIRNIMHGQVFDENFLMIVATFGAFAIKEFPEAVAVMLFYQIGEFFQDLAVSRSRKEIASLMDIRPDFANIVKEDGSLELTDPELVEVDNIIRVNPGEKIPLDGVIISGSSSIDSKALTGESLPVDVIEGSKVISGTINLTSTIDIRVEKTFENSAVNKILELVENASNVKSKQENFISKFAKWYTPIVVFSALIMLLLGGLISKDWVTWISRSLNFLVISCPCAIVISVPLSFFTSIGRAAKLGILIKGSLYLENFNNAKTFIFDKTGTLTKGNFVVTKILPKEKMEEIAKVAYICEYNSSHPIALSIKSLMNEVVDSSFKIDNVPGLGIIASDGKDTLYCGNASLLKENGFIFKEVDEVGTLIYVAKNKEYLGVIVIEDEIKEESKEVISYLNKNNIKTILLSGDNQKVVDHVSEELMIHEAYGELLPVDKVNKLEEILSSKKKGELVAYVGDGINDAPVLMRSDIGISMGGVGSDAAIEASDIVLMHDDLSSLLKAKKIAKKTLLIVKENIIFAIGVKIAILILSIFGLASIWLAVFGDVGVAVHCVLNALRSGRIK